MNRATFNREVGASRMAGHLQEFGHAGHYSSDLHGWIQMGTAAPYRSVRDIRLRAKLEELKHSMRPRTSHGRAAAEHANRISGCEGSQRILQRYLSMSSWAFFVLPYCYESLAERVMYLPRVRSKFDEASSKRLSLLKAS